MPCAQPGRQARARACVYACTASFLYNGGMLPTAICAGAIVNAGLPRRTEMARMSPSTRAKLTASNSDVASAAPAPVWTTTASTMEVLYDSLRLSDGAAPPSSSAAAPTAIVVIVVEPDRPPPLCFAATTARAPTINTRHPTVAPTVEATPLLAPAPPESASASASAPPVDAAPTRARGNAAECDTGVALPTEAVAFCNLGGGDVGVVKFNRS